MALTINLKKKVHRKVWESVFTQLPVATAAGAIWVGDNFNMGDGSQAYYITGVSSIYLYRKDEEAFGLLPNSGSAGTFGAGAAGFVHPVGPSFTASSGTTTSFVSTLTINRDLRGYRFRVTGGTNKGVEGIISSNSLGANSAFKTVDTYTAFDNTSVIVLLTNRLWFYVPGATSGFNYYDFATNAWTSRSVVSGPAITANEGCLIGTPAQEAVMETGTASGAGTTTLLDATRSWTVNEFARCLLKVISGTGAGSYRYITSNTAGALTLDTSLTTDATSVYEISGNWSDVASAGATTSITVGTGTPFTASQWIGYQVRAVAGTGAGQVATITANANNSVSFAAVSTAFDSTTRYVIEPNDDALWFLGGAAVTLFKYSISGNTWATVTPTAARAAVAGAGTSASWIGNVKDPLWRGVGSAGGYSGNLKTNGRYILSFRGTAGGVLDVYDIPVNTWYSGVNYAGASNETFTTGSTYCDIDGFIYVQKDATGRFFRFDVAKNDLQPLTTNATTQGTAISGARLIVDKYTDPANGKSLRWLYWALNTSTQIQRLLEI